MAAMTPPPEEKKPVLSPTPKKWTTGAARQGMRQAGSERAREPRRHLGGSRLRIEVRDAVWEGRLAYDAILQRATPAEGEGNLRRRVRARRDARWTTLPGWLPPSSSPSFSALGT